MSLYGRNPYYNPSAMGLKLLLDIDAYDEAYEFALFIVLQDKDGKVYVGSDSGCSCPTPFEDHKFPEDFSEVQSWDDVKREYAARYPDKHWSSRQPASITASRHAVVGAFRRG